ncbi:hypothetical protein [Shouchella patagoniensis]|uniref:hypothetical protein n=1 Tax=Shouchella patagoniensis TaxID=228576 RepID=UPI000994AF4E|nr:hypothetical protein [Shouchella patagoniensis]
MAKKREYGKVHPGVKWGPFTMRLPGIHVEWKLTQLLQGGLLLLATCGSVTPLAMNYFDVSFEVAWTLSLFFLFFVLAQTMFFGDVYAGGGITPALPLTLIFIGAFTPGVEVIQALTALFILSSLLFVFFGITGLGAKFNEMVPNVLKAGIIMGGAVAAFQSELNRMPQMPYSIITAWIVVLFLFYSLPFKKMADTRTKIFVGGNALLLSLVAAAIVGSIAGEVHFDISWGFFIPPLGETFAAMSVWSIGFPSLGLFIKMLPLGLLIYILAFSDLLIGDTLMKDADKVRIDEKIDVNATRSHYVLAARNLLQALTVGPLLWLHGPIWVGVQVFLIERYKQGRHVMDSIFSGPMNFYILAIPLGLLMPIIGIITPMFPVALSVALLLTGFACAYVAMSMMEDQTTGGMILAIGMVTAFLGPAWGIVSGIILYILLIGIRAKKHEEIEDSNGKEIS